MKRTLRASQQLGIFASAAWCCLLLAGDNADGQIVSGRPVAVSYANELELLRYNLRTEIREIMRSNFVLPREEADIFWPLYMDYATEVSTIWDKRQEVIEKVVAILLAQLPKGAPSKLRYGFLGPRLPGPGIPNSRWTTRENRSDQGGGSGL